MTIESVDWQEDDPDVDEAVVHAVLGILGWPDDRRPQNARAGVPVGSHWDYAADIARAALAAQTEKIKENP